MEQIIPIINKIMITLGAIVGGLQIFDGARMLDQGLSGKLKIIGGLLIVAAPFIIKGVLEQLGISGIDPTVIDR